MHVSQKPAARKNFKLSAIYVIVWAICHHTSRARPSILRRLVLRPVHFAARLDPTCSCGDDVRPGLVSCARGWNRRGRRLFGERTPDRVLACRLSWFSRQPILALRYLADNWGDRQSGLCRRKLLPRSGADSPHLPMQSIRPAGSGVTRDLSQQHRIHSITFHRDLFYLPDAPRLLPVHRAPDVAVYLVVAGLVFGFMALTKPQAIFVPGFLALLWLFTSEGWQRRWVVVARTCLVYVMMACALVPWAVRNTTVFGELVLISTNGGSILLTGNNPSAVGKATDDAPLVKKRNFSVEDQVAANKRARQLAIDWITSNPKRFLELIPLKIFYNWAPDGEAEWYYQRGFESYEKHRYLFRGIRVLNQGYYLLLILSFAVAIFPLWRYRHKTAWP